MWSATSSDASARRGAGLGEVVVGRNSAIAPRTATTVALIGLPSEWASASPGAERQLDRLTEVTRRRVADEHQAAVAAITNRIGCSIAPGCVTPRRPFSTT